MSVLLLSKKQIDPSLLDFYLPGVLVTWQQSSPRSEKLRWVSNSSKLNKQPRVWETQDSHCVLPGSPTSPIFSFLHSFTHHSALRKIISVPGVLRTPPSGSSEHPKLDFVQLPLKHKLSVCPYYCMYVFWMSWSLPLSQSWCAHNGGENCQKVYFPLGYTFHNPQWLRYPLY